MYQTQVSLTDKQYRFLQNQARQLGASVADVMHQLVDRTVLAQEESLADDPIWEMIGLFHGGEPRDTSERVDEILYGLQTES